MSESREPWARAILDQNRRWLLSWFLAATGDPAAEPAAGAAVTNPNAPATTESAAPPQTVVPPGCVLEDTNFLNGNKVWEYQYILMFAVAFCVFWYFYKRSD